MATKRIGLFGGAFDPPHIGHIEVIRSVLHSGRVDEVWVVPAGRRVEKKMESSGEDRLVMCALMVEEHFKSKTCVIVVDEQVRSDKPSFSIDMYNEYRNLYPEYEFWMIVGDDVFPDIHSWKESEKLLEIAPFIIVERTGISEESAQFPKKYVIIPRLVAISSTIVRGFCQEGKDISIYVNPSVAEYIKKKGLYSA